MGAKCVVTNSQWSAHFLLLDIDKNVCLESLIKWLHYFLSSVRSSNSHPDLLVIHHPTQLFQITPVLNTGLSLSEPLQLYKGNHWTRCAGFIDASWIRLGITNDDLGAVHILRNTNLGSRETPPCNIVVNWEDPPPH